MRIEIRSRNLVFLLHNTKEHMRNDNSSLSFSSLIFF